MRRQLVLTAFVCLILLPAVALANPTIDRPLYGMHWLQMASQHKVWSTGARDVVALADGRPISPAWVSFGTPLGEYRGCTAYSNGNDHDLNGPYGTYGYQYQCVEYVNRFYATVLGHRNMRGSGNANQYYGKAAQLGLDAYANGSTAPEEGDILCSNYDVGHVAIVRSVDSTSVHAIQQNWSNDYGDADFVLSRSGNNVSGFSSKYSIVGWLRKPGGGGNPAQAIIDSVTPQHPYGGQTIHFRGHGTCASGYSITGYEWWSHEYGYIGNGASVDRSLPAGSHTISFRVQRSDGLWSDRVYWQGNPLVVDPHTSVATIDSITPQRPYDGQTIQFNGHGTCVSGHAITDYEWWSHEHGYVGGSASVSVKLPAGSHTISFRTKCSGGEWSARKYWTGNPLVVKPHTVTAVIDSVTPLSPYRGQTLKLSGHCSCNVGHVGAVYQWYSTLDGIIGASDMVYTQDLSAGEHTIKFRVQCTGGRLSAWQAFGQKIVVREPPGGTDWRIAIDPPLPATVQGTITVTGYAQELAGPRHIEAVEVFANGKVLTWNANFDATTGRWSYVWDTWPRAGEVVILLVRASDGSFWVDDTAVVEVLPTVHATANIAPGTWLMGLPVVPRYADAAHVFATSNVAAWDATTHTYHLYQAQAFSVMSGYGYWASYDALQALDIAGAHAAGPVTCNVAPGWNLLGNPYDEALAWSNVDGNGKLEPFAWRQSLDGSAYELVSDLEGLSAVHTIPRWRGMWVWATGSGTVSLARTAPASVPASGEPEVVWASRLSACAGKAVDADNFVGQTSTTSPLQAANPPLIGRDYVDLYMLDAHGRRQAVSLAAAGAQTSWDVCVETNLPGADVIVRFPDLSAVPRDLALTLTDLDAGKTLNMRTSAGYSFTAGQEVTTRHLRVAATPRSGPVLTVSGVSVRALAENAAITYCLSAPAEVTITVLNIAGRVVATIPVGYRQGGAHTSTWSMRSSSGTKVPSGQYLVRLRCRAEEGTEVSHIVPATVR